MCNGKEDPLVCPAAKAICDLPIIGDRTRDLCPVLCKSCEAPTLISTVTSSTTTVDACEGQNDPVDCSAFADYQDLCDDLYFGTDLRKACPVFCGACELPTITATSSTTTTTTIPKCNDREDPDFCTDTVGKYCDRPNEFPLYDVPKLCPVLCNTCPDPSTLCNGELDPSECGLFDTILCTKNDVTGRQLRTNCPALCTTCIITTFLTTTTTTVPPPSCDGLEDPADFCNELSRNLCTNELAGATVRAMCPAMCDSCVTTATPALTVATCNGKQDDINCAGLDGFCFIAAVSEGCPVLCESCLSPTMEATTATLTANEQTSNAATDATRDAPTETPIKESRTGVPTTVTLTQATTSLPTQMPTTEVPTTEVPITVTLTLTPTNTATTASTTDLTSEVATTNELTGAPKTCHGNEDPNVCASAELAVFCDGQAGFDIFDVPTLCRALCGNCETTTAPTTTAPATSAKHCGADNNGYLLDLSKAIGSGGWPLEGVETCADAASWCRVGSTTVIPGGPNSFWAISDVLTEVQQVACPTTCVNGC
jgi:hypothetical protein